MNDIIAISNSIDHPDMFLPMNCNTRWPEIEAYLLPGQQASDRPDLSNRVFRMKHKLLTAQLKEDKPLESTAAGVSVIKFQLRGMVHAHITCYFAMKQERKLENPARIYEVIPAKTPTEAESVLREHTVKHLIHRPYTLDFHARCLCGWKCSKRFPKDFKDKISANESDFHISHRRRSPKQGEDQVTISDIVPEKGKQQIKVKNSWVVPHSLELILKFNCHLKA